MGISDAGTTGNVVLGNYIGTNAAGTVTLANAGDGVDVKNGAANNTVGGTAPGALNVISGSGNVNVGIFDAGTSGNLVAGNLIGTDATGTMSLSTNTDNDSVAIGFSATNNTIGGPTSAARNIISGAPNYGGAVISDNAQNNLIQGNYIGTDVTGNVALANGFGVDIFNHNQSGNPGNATINNTVQGNLISGNRFAGLYIEQTNTNNNTVIGNYIGTNAAGTGALANLAGGVVVRGGAQQNTIGGPAAANRNIISGNVGDGIQISDISTSGNVVQGNYIGTDVNGTAALGNTRYGIALNSASRSNILGNTISGNLSDGVHVNGPLSVSGGVSWWQAEGNANDTLGNNNGTLHNGVTFTPGIIGQAFNFNGTNQYVTFPRIQLPSGLTYTAWVQTTSTLATTASGYPGDPPLTVVGDSTGFTWANFGVSGGRIQYRYAIFPTGWVTITGNAFVNDGNWHFIAVTHDQATGNISLYVDGNLDATGQVAYVPQYTATDSIGGGYLDRDTFAGAVDEVHVFNRPLTSAEIAQVYAIGNTIQGNKIGTNAGGTAGLANGGSGVVLSGAVDNLIGGTTAAARNIISGNTQYGVLIPYSGSTGNLLEGNYVGTDVTGMLALPNTPGAFSGGVEIDAPGNTIGGSAVGAGNVIAGNSGDTELRVYGDNNLIAGNLIAVNATASAILTNSSLGIIIGGFTNTIGGTAPGAGNVISSGGRGVLLTNGRGGNLVQGNWIGTNASDATNLGNDTGIAISDSTNNTIGGTMPGARNIISGNSARGIQITGATTTGNLVEGNFIGTNNAGNGALGNGNGVEVVAGAHGNTIGGIAPGVQQLILQNGPLAGPEGIAVAANGDLIVADSNNQELLRINPQTGAASVISSGGQFQVPKGVALAPDGTIYVADTYAHAVFRVDPITGAQTVVSSGGSFSQPYDIAVAANGDLYVVDLNAFGTGAVFHVNPTTGAQTVVGTNPTGLSPQGVAIDGNGNLLVTYMPAGGGSGEVDRINPVTNAQTVVSSGGLLVQPTDIALDHNGSILVINLNGGNPSLPGNVVQIDPNTGAQSVAYTGAPFAFPDFLEVAPSGDVYVSNFDQAFNSQLLRIPTNAARNIISGNTGNGVYVTDSGTNTNVVEGNYVGTDASGNALLRGTVASYRAEGNANDELGLHNGTIQGGVSFVPGEVGQAFSFDGSTGTIRVTNSSAFEPAYTVTVEGWVKSSSAQIKPFQWILAKGADGTISPSYGLYTGGDGGLFFDVYNGQGVGAISPDAGTGIWDGNWHHVAGTYDGQMVRLYVDGVQLGSGTPANFRIGYNLSSTNDLYIGSYAANSNIAGFNTFFNGSVDELAVCNRTLSAAEIQGICAARNSGKPHALGNRGSGVLITNGAQNNTVGGTASGAGNVISGQFMVNTAGVLIGVPLDLSTNNNLVAGNYIGTDAGGTKAEGNYHGILLEASNNIIGGTTAAARNVISGNDVVGVLIEGDSEIAFSGNVVEGNYVGTDYTGTTAVGNDIGIETSSTLNNTIGGLTATPGTGPGNVISGNTGPMFGDGIYLAGSNDVVEGNLIGTNAAGNGVVGNDEGISVTGTNNTIGGTSTQARNILSGNQTGMAISGTGATANIVDNNYIGTTPAGDKALGNMIYGIILEAPSNIIGQPSAGNVILGGAPGYAIFGSGASNTLFQANYIGVNAAGSAALPGGGGILIESSSNVTIGGVGYGTANVIAGGGTDDGTGHVVPGTANAYLEFLYGSNELVQANLIGTDVTGTVGLGVSGGVILDEVSNSTIGGTAAGAPNVISSSRYYGVLVTGYQSTGNLVQGNKIGTNLAGTAALPNATYGVWLAATAANNTVDQNVISGNSADGVFIDGTGVPDGNVVWYKADGNANNSGNYSAGLVATINGGVTFGPGKSGQAFQFHNTASESITVTDPNQYLATTAVTVEGWINLNSIPTLAADYAVASYAITSNSENYGLYVNNDNGTPALLLEWYNGANYKLHIDVPGLTTGAYHHVAVTADGLTAKFYIDGTLVGSLAMPVPLLRTPGTLQIGRAAPFGNFFDGSIDDLAIYNRVLTGTEIQRIYNANGGSKGGSGTSNNTLTGNLVGLNVGGTAALANGGNGVLINNSFGNFIGGTASGAGNTVSGNAGSGIDIYGTEAANNLLQGNIVGLNAAGTSAIPNVSYYGVFLGGGATNNTVGGVTGAARNILSGNGYAGLGIYDPGTTGNLVEGNYLGTDITGMAAAGNGSFGAVIAYGGTGNTIGGTTSAAQNIISGNSYGGIDLFGAGTTANLLEGNYIGLAKDGATALPNAVMGIFVRAGAANNSIGGPVAGEGNTIAFNHGAGVQVGSNNADSTTIGNAIRANIIHDNGGLGIDLGGSGVPIANDSQGHVGPNNFQNFPIIGTVIPSPTNSSFKGTLASTPNTTFTIDFYANNAQDPSGYGEGAIYLGSTMVGTDASGSASFDILLNAAVSPGQYITATVTDQNGNTSEFAQNFVAPVVNLPVITIGGPATINEGVPVAYTANVTDANPGVSFTYTWTVTQAGNPSFALPGNVVTDQPTLRFTPTNQGTYQIQVLVVDSAGAASTATTTLTVGPAGPGVTITGTPFGATVNTAVNLGSQVTDPAGAAITNYAWSVLLNGQTYNPGTATTNSTFSFTPTTAGVYAVTLIVTDATGAQGAGLTSFDATSANPPATIIAPATGAEGTAITATSVVGDPSLAVPLTYAWAVLKNGIGFASQTSNSNAFTFTPNDEGSYQITLTVTDKNGNSGSANPVTVAVGDTAPTVSISGPTTAAAGTAVTFTANGSTPNTVDSNSFSWSVLSSGTGATITGSGPTFTYTPSASGFDVVTLTDTDDDGVANSANLLVSVSIPTATPTISLAPNGSILEGTSSSFKATILNPSASATYKYNWSVKGESNTFSAFTIDGPTSSSTDNFSFTPPSVGAYLVSVTFTGSDGTNGTATYLAQATNVAPTVSITGQPGNTVNEGTIITLSAQASDPGGASDIVSYSWSITGPDNFSQSGNSKTITFTPNEVGSYSASVTVTDSSGATGTASTSITISHVRPIPSVQVIASQTYITPSAGKNLPATLHVGLHANVPDPGSDDAFTYNWTATDIDSGVPTVQSGSSPDFTFFGLAQDTFSVSLTVTDADGGNETVNIPLDVYQGNQSGTLHMVPNDTTASQIIAIAIDSNPGDKTKIDGSLVTVPFVASATGTGHSAATGGDTLVGGKGPNVLQGDSGFNSLIGGSGPNTMFGTANDTLVGGSASGSGNTSNMFNLTPGAGEVVTAGNLGVSTNTLSFTQANSGVTVNLAQTGVQNIDGNGSTLAINGQFQNLVGSGGNDQLFAASNSTIYGGGGNDQITANHVSNAIIVNGNSADLAAAMGVPGMSNTSQFGSSGGNSTLNTSGGSSVTVVGGSGNSTINSTGGSGVTIFGSSGNSSISSSGGSSVSVQGGSGNSTLSATGGTNITLFGSSGNSTINTSGGSSVSVMGGSGNSTISSTNGSNVTIFGSSGNSSISSSGGSSVSVQGGSGNSTISSTNGSNITIFGSSGNSTVNTSGGSSVSVIGGSGNSSVSNSGGSNITIFGSSGNSTISSSGGSSVSLSGGSGNSTISSSGGNSITIFGGSGNDSLSTTNGSSVTVVGGSGNSTISSSGGSHVTIFGSSGNSTISSSSDSSVSIIGGSGNSSVSASGSSNITIFGSSGNSTVNTSGGSSVSVSGGSGNSTIASTNGSNITIFGSSGNSSISSSGGTSVTVVGGGGNSTVSTTGGSNITIFGSSGNSTVNTSGGTSVSVQGGSGNSTISSTNGSNVTIFGSSGNSSISSSGGSSVSLSGSGGNTTISSSGGSSITLFGGSGNSSLSTSNGSNVTVVGGSGNSTLASTGGTSITLFGGSGNSSISNSGGSSVSVVGGSGNSTITSSGGSSITLFGGSGNDSISTTNGSNVTVVGGTGNSTIASSGGTSITLFGGTGNDSISHSGGSSVSIIGGSGNSTVQTSGGSSITIFGGSGNDSLSATNGTNVTVIGGTGNSTLASSGGSNITLFGGTGNDSISSTGGSSVSVISGSGNSTIHASGGSSITIFGGTGNDSIATSNLVGAIVEGGRGDDSITSASDTTITIAGGAGNDTFGTSGDVTATVIAGGTRGVQMSVTGGTSVSLYGGSGDDTLTAVGGQSIYLFGEDGNNTYQLTGTASNPLSVFVNDLNTNSQTIATTDNTPNGINTLQFPGVSGITIDLSSFSTGTMPTGSQIQQVAAGLTVAMTGQFQNVVGTTGNDYIKGNSGPNVLDAGGSGNDTLVGGSGPATLIAGNGNDSLVAGSGGTTYRFPSGTTGSAIVDPPVDTSGLNALDFSQFGTAVSINLGLTSAQSVGGGLTVTLQNPSAINGYVATAFNDNVTGNSADDRFFVGAGNDTFVGGGGNDTYFFNGNHLGSDTITETPTTNNALNFLAFDGPINLDLTQSSQQTLNSGNLALTLTNPSAIDTVVGSKFSSTIKGNGGNDTLISGGGQSSLVAGNGNDNLQGYVTQVVYLQFLTSTLPGIHNYTTDEQSAILSNLQKTYAAFNYFFTLDQPTAQQHAQVTGGRYATLIFNQGPAGGAANELDPGNVDLGGTATINVSPFLGDPANGLVMPSSSNIVGLSSTIAAHELGHLSGLQHQDALGPIGTGIYAGVNPSKFNPIFTGPQNATETPLDIMASPDSVGTTLANAASQTQIGERDAVKLAFNDTGTFVQQSSLPTEPFHLVNGVNSAYVVNNLPGLTVPNTLMAGTRDYGQTFDVNAVAIKGALATPTQEDFYAITAPAGQLAIQVISRNNTLNAQPIIPELEVLDANGNQVAYNEREFESLDSTLLDLSLTAGATYYVGVDSFQSLTVGNYQLFMYSFATGPVQNSGDTMVGGGGNDTIQGSSGNDFVTFLSGSAGSATVNAASGHDTVDLTPAPGEKLTTIGNVTVIRPTTSTTATSLQSSANPSVYSQQVTFTATVTTSGAGTPTGTVTFYDGNTVLSTQSLNQVPGNDQATYSTSSLSVATHSITATYNGDPNFTTSTSSAVSQVVNQDGTTTSVSSSANPSVYGQGVTFTATVTAASPGSGTPTGTVNFYDGNTLLGSGTLNQVAGNDQATFSITTLSVATHSITASYQTDGNFTTSTSSAVSQVVSPANTTTALSSSANPSVFGQSVTFTATVAPVDPGAGTPTGTVLFYDGNTQIGSGTLNQIAGNDQAAFTTSTLSVATHSITAAYQTDGNFANSTSSAVSQVVNAANTTTSLSSSVNPSVFGQNVTFTATVAAVAPGAGTPTGTVLFYDDNTQIGSGTLNQVAGNDQATYSTTTLSVATHSITASYQTDGNFATSTSGAVSQVVNAASTTTSLSSSVNPSVFGQSVTFTATVAPVAPGAGTPTGTVLFYDGSNQIGSGTLNQVAGNDQATYSTTSLSVATHSITAKYQTDGNFANSTSSAVSQVVNAASTTTSLSSSVNPSVYGQSVTFTATVAAVAPGAGTPTGTVNFYDNNGATLLGSGTLNQVAGNDQATFSISTLSVATHSITATYQTDGNFANSTSSAVSQVVNAANTTTSLSSSVNPSVFGQSVTFTATVAAVAPGAGTPTGTVLFFDGSTQIGSGTLNKVAGNDQATYSTTTLSVATHSITAKYQTDGNFANSTSSAVSQVVNAANTTTSLASSVNPSVYGQSVTFTATVAAVSPGAGTPTGTVLFYDGNTQIGSGTLNQVSGNDQATYSTTTLSVATHSITAKYQTDGNFAASTSSAVSQVVNMANTTTSISSSVNPSVYGQSVTFTATVAAVSPGAGAPTGTVNFYDGNTQIGSGTLAVVNGQDQATYSTSTLNAASHSITAKYAGDTNFSTSTSSALSQTVNQANTTTAGSASGSGYFGTAETFTATVTANSPSTATVVGTVDFFDTTTNNDLGTVALSNGKASLTTTMLPTGTQTIKMTYNGNANFVTSNTSVSVSIVTSIFVMDGSATNALNATGDSVINIPGLVFVDSNASVALRAGDEASITAGAIQVVGGYKKASGATLNPTPQTGVATVSDPWAGLVAPTGGTKMGSISISGTTTKTINPGIYSSISVSGSATLILNPGIYVLAGGNLTISNSGTVKGSGVMIYNAGSNYPKSGGTFGSISLSGSATLNISAATTGTYAGVAIFQSRDNTMTLTAGGSSLVNLQGGLLYAIKAQLSISSKAALRRVPTIVDLLSISNNAVIKNTDTNSPTAAIVPDVSAQQTAFVLTTPGQPTANGTAGLVAPIEATAGQAFQVNETRNGAAASVDLFSTSNAAAAQDAQLSDNGLTDEYWLLALDGAPKADGGRPTSRRSSGR